MIASFALVSGVCWVFIGARRLRAALHDVTAPLP